MGGATPKVVARCLARLRRARLPEQDRAELQVAASVFAGRVFPGVDWLGKLGEDVVMTSTTYQKIIERGEKLGLQRGEQRAEERNLARLRALAASMTRRHHGRAPRELRGVLASVSSADALLALIERIAELDSADEVLTAARAAAKRSGRRRR